MIFTNPLPKTRIKDNKNPLINFEFDMSYYKDHESRVIKTFKIKI